MRMKSKLPLKRLATDQSGLAMVELAMLAPVLGLMLVGTVDYSFQIMAKLTVESAARDGAAYAVAHGYDSALISSAITTNTRQASFLSAITASPAPSKWYGCPNSATGVTTAANATTVCTSTGNAAGTYVTSTATATYTYLLPWPSITGSKTVVSRITVRII